MPSTRQGRKSTEPAEQPLVQSLDSQWYNKVSSEKMEVLSKRWEFLAHFIDFQGYN